MIKDISERVRGPGEVDTCSAQNAATLANAPSVRQSLVAAYERSEAREVRCGYMVWCWLRSMRISSLKVVMEKVCTSVGQWLHSGGCPRDTRGCPLDWSAGAEAASAACVQELCMWAMAGGVGCRRLVCACHHPATRVCVRAPLTLHRWRAQCLHALCCWLCGLSAAANFAREGGAARRLACSPRTPCRAWGRSPKEFAWRCRASWPCFPACARNMTMCPQVRSCMHCGVCAHIVRRLCLACRVGVMQVGACALRPVITRACVGVLHALDVCWCVSVCWRCVLVWWQPCDGC